MPKDIRDAFFDRICEYALKDDKVIIITDDMDVFSLRNFKKTCPDRFINAGVAEQQIINCAAGLAALPVVRLVSEWRPSSQGVL